MLCWVFITDCSVPVCVAGVGLLCASLWFIGFVMLAIVWFSVGCCFDSFLFARFTWFLVGFVGYLLVMWVDCG